MNKAWFIFLSIFLPLVSAGVGFSSKYYIPKIKPLIIKEIKKQAADYVKLDLENQNIGFTWIPLSLYVNELKVTPIKKTKTFLSPFVVQNLQVELSTIDLFKGNINISNININDSTLNIIIKKFDQQKDSKFKSFDILNKIPINKVNLNKVQLYIKIVPIKLSLYAENIKASCENLKNALITNVTTPKLIIKQSNYKRKFSLKINSKFLLEDNRILISKLEAKHTDQSFLNLLGQLDGDWLNNDINKININTSGQLLTQEALGIAKAFMPETQFPFSSGSVQFDVNYNDNDSIIGKPIFKFKTKNLKVSKYPIGDLNVNATIDNEKLIIKDFSIKNDILQVDNSSIELKLNKNAEINSKLKINKFSLWNLLRMLNSDSEPSTLVELIAKGNANCQGQLRPRIKVVCDTKVNNSEFTLDKIKPKDSLINVKNISGDAKVTITHKAVSYDGKVIINDSSALAKGSAIYDRGFNVDFDGSIADAKKDIANLVGLELEGKIDILGSVTGNSKTATLISKAECIDCRMKGWELGGFISDVSYKSGVLILDKIIGIIGESTHNSDVKVDIKNSSIEVSSDISKLELKDVKMAIKDKVPLPFNMDSTGSAKFKLWGPLKLQDLNFNLDSNFLYGFINKESFDEARIKLTCRTGNIKTDQLYLKKADSKLTINGELRRDGSLDLKGRMPSLQLKNSEHFDDLKTEIDGQMAIDASLTGFISEPKLSVKGVLKNSSLGDKAHKDSSIILKLDKKVLNASVSLNKKQFTSNIIYPFDNSDAYIKTKAQNWNFSHILEGFFPHFKKFNLFTNFNGTTDLIIPNKDFNKTKGTINVNSFFILRGAYSIYLEKPLVINFDEGRFSDFDVKFKGQRTDLNVTSTGSQFKKLNLKARGQLDLGIGLIFSSLIEEFKGETSVSLGLTGPLENINMFGSIYIQDSTLKLFSLAQPIEEIQSEITVRNNSLFINSLVGEFGGGSINASGLVQFKNESVPKLNIKGRIDNSNFKSIAGVDVVFDGDIQLQGEKLPYLLTASTNIKKGKIDKSVSIDGGSNTKFKISEYAPKESQLAKENAIKLNVIANFEKPIPTKIVTTQFELVTNLSGQLKITNTPQKPKLEGRIDFTDDGTILFRNNEYILKTGYLTYENQPPSNPFLYIDAEGRIQDYDVTISVLGSGNDPKFNFQSSPSLPESEIINLVALGYTSTDIDNETGPQDQTEQLMFDAGSSIIKEKLGFTRGMNDKLGIDLDISSTYNDDQSKPIPVVTLKKKIGRKLDATASRTIEAKATNSFKLEYKLNRNLGIIGSFIQEEGKDTTNSDNDTGEALGLDFEYKLEFK